MKRAVSEFLHVLQCAPEQETLAPACVNVGGAKQEIILVKISTEAQ
jgi:hypothetical protein